MIEIIIHMALNNYYSAIDIPTTLISLFGVIGDKLCEQCSSLCWFFHGYAVTTVIENINFC